MRACFGVSWLVGAVFSLGCSVPVGGARADEPASSEQGLVTRPPSETPRATGTRCGRVALSVFAAGAWLVEGGETHSFGMAGDVPITGDWNGDGRTKIGVFRSLSDGHAVFSLDVDGDGVWNPQTDAAPYFGLAGDVPVSGDWNGDGRTKIGVFRSLPDGHGVFSLDMNGDGAWTPPVDKTIYFGLAGDLPVIGDWNGDGRSKLGVFRSLSDGHGQFSLDVDGDGVWNPQHDAAPYFGLAGDVPVSGDWNCDGRSKIGVVRPSGGLLSWSLDVDGSRSWDSSRDVAVTFGVATALPTTIAK